MGLGYHSYAPWTSTNACWVSLVFFFPSRAAAGCFDVGNRPKPRVTVTRNCTGNFSTVRDIQSSSWLSKISLKLNDKYVSRKQTHLLPWIAKPKSKTQKSFPSGIQMTLSHYASYSSTRFSFSARGGGRGTPYNSLYGKTPPERGTFLSGFRVVYERVEILLVEVYKRVGKYVIWVCESSQRAEQINFMAL